MPNAQHPAWSGSKIPPRTLAKINNLSGEYRRNYLSDLIADYTQRTDNIEALAKKMSERWLVRQKEHLRLVIQELCDILDMEIGQEPTFHRIDDDTIN